ncbi:hypothetical protein HHL19_22285 [Streptomyces sp. R302]|uniref:DUF732 domain-containing protein n=1 Tax=unclassified Streptomyces TaxID=2593676 RepID=UPI00145E080C|nr:MULTISPECIES: DUF732 domain-containing protein [unclassified Streptomyces]NML51694.1 hypothetical protein [Streptomyces sp. R301]NML81314.1 hypothetical protein [Streptomyces sp. R302]
MRIRTAAAVAVLAVALVGCGTDSDRHRPTTVEIPSPTHARTPPATGTAHTGTGAGNAGIPPEPTGARRDAVLAAIRDVNAGLAHDEEKAIDAARSQCAALDGGAAEPDRSAVRRFSYDGVTLTRDDGSHLNIGLRRTLCPES